MALKNYTPFLSALRDNCDLDNCLLITLSFCFRYVVKGLSFDLRLRVIKLSK